MAIIIDGRAVAEKLRQQIAADTQKFISERGIVPGLAVVIVGDDPASHIYVRNKKRACGEVGFYSEVIELPQDTTMDELKTVVERLNKDEVIHGMLVQLPLPPQLDDREIIQAIDPKKDVDAFHPINTGGILAGKYDFLPCTPSGIMALLRAYDISVDGRECVVVGRSNIVGKPMALLLLESNGTVTVCHSRTKHLEEHCRRADILISAVGKPGLIRGDMVKPGAVVIDVGTTRLPDGKLAGDAAFDEVARVASHITPVPGGIGPMTIAILLQNTLTAARLQSGAK